MIKITASSSKIQLLKNKYQSAAHVGDFRAFRKVQALLLYLEKEFSLAEVASFLSISYETARTWLVDFAVNGMASIKVKIRVGRQPKLSQSQLNELKQALQNGPEEHGFLGGCWNSAMILEWIKSKFKVEYSVKYVPQLLRRIGFSYQKAAFELNKADSDARKNWLSKSWPGIKRLATNKKATIYFEDEASFAMWGSLAYTWAPRGQQPTLSTSGNRKSYKVFGAIGFESGKLIYQGTEGKLNAESYIKFLRHVLSKTKGHIILIHDGAPYHRAKIVQEFVESKKERITLKRLPAYSPDYNPIERIWRKAKRLGTHLKFFPTFESLKQQVEKTMEELKKRKDEIKDLFSPYNTARQPK